MVTIDLFASLSMLKTEVDATLTMTQDEIQAFVDNPEDSDSLFACRDHLAQLVGIFKMVGFEEVLFLLEHLKSLAISLESMISSEHQDGAEDHLVALGKGVMSLRHYLDRLETKKRRLPPLLLPAINDALKVLEKSIISESHFFALDHTLKRNYDAASEGVDREELGKSIRRLRHMYQVGLLELLRDEDAGQLAFILRSLDRIDRLSGECEMGLLWWLSKGAVLAFQRGGVTLTKPRLSVLGKVDRQVKRLVYEGLDILNEKPPKELLNECLYLVALADPEESVIANIQQQIQGADIIRDAELQTEMMAMNGPGEAVLSTVANALREELTRIEDHLDLSARGIDLAEDYFVKVAEEIRRVSQTLLMLGLTSESASLIEKADKVATWKPGVTNTSADDYQAAAHSLIAAENAVDDLIRGTTTTGEEGACRISGSVLDQARKIVVTEVRGGLALVKKSVSSYIDTHWEKTHLKNVPVAMKSVWGGVIFLEQPRAAAVVDACSSYLTDLMEQTSEESYPSSNELETLADAMTSIDYFLEGIEENKPIGVGVLELAEESIRELGIELAAVG